MNRYPEYVSETIMLRSLAILICALLPAALAAQDVPGLAGATSPPRKRPGILANGRVTARFNNRGLESLTDAQTKFTHRLAKDEFAITIAGRSYDGLSLGTPSRENEDDRVTFEAFSRASLTLAHRLLADGVKKGDRVAIVMRNLPEWAVCFFACMLVGAIATPLNAWWTGPELAYGLNDSGARLLIADG